jgi:hypothetical protein
MRITEVQTQQQTAMQTRNMKAVIVRWSVRLLIIVVLAIVLGMALFATNAVSK